MPKSYHLNRLGSARYTELKQTKIIPSYQNKIKHDKLILNGSTRETYGQDYEPFFIPNFAYDPDLDPSSWKSIIARRASFDPLMEGGNNNENRKDKATNKIRERN